MVVDPSPAANSTQRARLAVERAVEGIVRDLDPSAFETVHIWPGAHSTDTRPLPLPALRAAILVRDVASRRVVEWAQACRGAGVSWRDLAPVLGVEDAVDAFYVLRGDWERVYWRCRSCDAQVTDFGPFNGNPIDDEQGHAEGCKRHNAEVAEWRQRNGFDDDDE